MSLLESIKKSALKSGTVLPTDEESDKILAILNKLFYLDKNPKKEADLVEHIATRGTGKQERVGLHASNIIAHSDDVCIRRDVLSLVFKQNASDEDNISIGLKRIFEEGNSIHEKWQRLFVRGGYAEIDDIDTTRYNKEYMVSFSPDIISTIEPYGKLIVEIKSVNANQFNAMVKHPSAWKQIQLYMLFTGIHKGFVLNENKNTQDIKVEYYEFNKEYIKDELNRLNVIKEAYSRFVKDKKMIQKPKECFSVDCERCKKCYMKDACWNIGQGRRKI